MAQLTTDNLASGYRNRPVLSEICLSVAPGEVLALIGPNGAGKTTLLRALARQLRPSAGTVLLDESNLWDRSPSWVARRIAYAPQGKHGDRPVTVAESVALGRAPHRGWLLPLTRADHDAVQRSLQRAGLAGLNDRLLTELSAGEVQRVVLARALAQEPSVLLIDEPTSHLDLRYQGEILDCLQQLAREGMAVVLAVHDLNQAASWADRIALLVGGRLLAVGTPDEVLTAERLCSAYATELVVTRHPLFDLPLVTPAPRRDRTCCAIRAPRDEMAEPDA